MNKNVEIYGIFLIKFDIYDQTFLFQFLQCSSRVFDISQQFKENEENEDNQVSAETAINMRIERVFAYRAVCN